MITKNPLAINLDIMGVRDDMFTHQSKLHGAAHTNRVIVNILQIASSMGHGDLMPECWAAAYLHDLARRHDGMCDKHGEWAVSERLPSLKDFFVKAGVRNMDAVATAVRWHCRWDAYKGGILNPWTSEDPVHIVVALLKDADAMDRWRLPPNEYPDPSLMSMPQSHLRMFLPMSKEFFERTTAQSADWIRTWEIGVECYNPQIGCAEKIKDHWDPDETGEQRMKRRISQCQFVKNVESIVAKVSQMADKLERVNVPIRLYTYCNADSYKQFCVSGVWYSFWEAVDNKLNTWHAKYSDRPEDGRAYNDMRLWGEKGRFICSGILLPKDANGTEADKWARKAYGNVRIEWKADPSCMTFTVNDSHENPFAIPFTIPNLLAAIANHKRINFIEFQFHRPMTPADMAGVDQ